MFRRYPYWGWLLVSIILWSATGFRYYHHKQALQPARMARTISNDLINREHAFHAVYANKPLMDRMLQDSLTVDDANYLKSQPFFLFLYDKDSLTYWNSNTIVVNCDAKDSGKIKLLHHQRGIFVQECIPLQGADSSKKLTVLFPVVTLYPLENDYLHSRFVAADYIPVSTEVTPHEVNGSLAIKDVTGQPRFYILVHKHDIQHWVPDNATVWMIILSLVFSIAWLQLMMMYLVRKRSPIVGFIVTTVVIIAVRAFTYKYGLPFGLSNLVIFSPSLYASSTFLPSLGDLVINVLCLLWIVVFLVRHLPIRRAMLQGVNSVIQKLVGFALIAFIAIYAYAYVDVVKSLVLDSNISFDVSHFYSIDIYTIVGLITISVFTAVSCLLVYVINIQLDHIFENKWVHYTVISSVALVFIIICLWHHQYFYAALIVWLLLFMILLDVKALALVSDLLAPHMVFWAVFVCCFSVGILQYYNHIKEKETRKVVAEQLIIPNRDDVTEFAFVRTAKTMENDRRVRNYFLHPSASGRRSINQHFDATYLIGQLDKYQANIYLYDASGKSLYNKDTLSYFSLVDEVNHSIPTVADNFFYRESPNNVHSYIAYIPIDDTGKRIGYVFIDMSLKQAASETVYPELLQPSVVKNSISQTEYAYGIYEHDKLITRTHNYPFKDYLQEDTLSQGNFAFHDKQNYSELWYRYSKKKTIIVVHFHNTVIETITLFSYLFGIEILIAVLIMLYQLYLSYLVRSERAGRISLTLRKRIHFSMLFVVLVSFLIIGVVTITFFTDRYETSNKARLESIMQVVEQSVQQFLKQNKALISENTFDNATRSSKFKPFLTDLAGDQKIDINVYDNSGQLQATSQDDIYNRELLAAVIRPDAYYQLSKQRKSLLIQDEKIGDLSYLSCYVPIHDDNGDTYGYINVPFFSSEKELNFQISNILVTLINLYAFIFLVSSLFTVIITRWLTSTFNVIIKQFGKLNLERNELIDWPYDDEVGLLVREYNSMVKKVEENAALLAQSERESAWREMARQVAHEIKNPLTPMKLNIQYLQQALKNNYPNVHDLGLRVSDSLIEQIDNLSYIASEFSNFAKMPEARPEELDVNMLLENAVELYLNDANVTIMFNKHPEPILVYADKSQLMRVFSNLLENARQAIPSDRHGEIDVFFSRKDDKVIIAITDNGAGIPADTVKKIFQPYFTTKSSGTGLGLAMTKKIIEFWKGHIWFNTKEGEGTTFYIEMPLYNTE